MSRIAARTAAFERIFQSVMNRDAAEPDADFHTEVSGDDAAYASMLTEGVAAHAEEIKQAIANAVVGYDYERIFKVDLAILMLAAYEILFADEIKARFCDSAPNKAIACNEAVNLAKKYSTIKSPSFVNGVLSKIG